MFKSFLKHFSVFSGLLSLPLIASSCAAKASLENNKQEQEESIYKLEGQIFKSKTALVNYIKENVKVDVEQNDHNEQQKFWTIKVNNNVKKFSSPFLLNQFLLNNVEEIKANILPLDANNNYFDSKDDFIPSNLVIPLSRQEDGSFDEQTGLIEVFEGKDDTLYFGNESSSFDAKKSWMQFHNAYLFNGVYFQSKEDLEVYLNNKFFSDVQGSLANVTQKQFNFPMNVTNDKDNQQIYKTLTIPKNGENYDIEAFKSTLKNSIKEFSNKGISWKKSDGTLKSATFNEIINGLDSNIKDNLSSHVNVWELPDQRDKSFYIIDNEVDSKGNLFGDYFMELPYGPGSIENESGLGDINQWNKMENPNQSDLQNKDLGIEDLLGSFISLGLSTIWEQSINSKNSEENKNLGFLDIVDEQKLEDLVRKLNNFTSNNQQYPNLGTKLKEVESNLKKGKSYNPFYSLVILRSFFLSRLIDSSATNELIEETNKFFIEQIQKINNVFNAMLAPLFKNTTNSNNILDFNKILHFIDEQGNVSRHNSFYVDPRVHIQDFLGKNKHLLLAIKLYMASVSYYTKTSIKTFSEEEIQPKLNLPTDYNAFQNFENGQLYNKVKNSYTKNSAIFSNFYELNTQLNKAYETKIEETSITNKINATTKNNKADSFNLNKLEKTIGSMRLLHSLNTLNLISGGN